MGLVVCGTARTGGRSPTGCTSPTGSTPIFSYGSNLCPRPASSARCAGWDGMAWYDLAVALELSTRSGWRRPRRLSIRWRAHPAEPGPQLLGGCPILNPAARRRLRCCEARGTIRHYRPHNRRRANIDVNTRPAEYFEPSPMCPQRMECRGSPAPTKTPAASSRVLAKHWPFPGCLGLETHRNLGVSPRHNDPGAFTGRTSDAHRSRVRHRQVNPARSGKEVHPAMNKSCRCELHVICPHPTPLLLLLAAANKLRHRICWTPDPIRVERGAGGGVCDSQGNRLRACGPGRREATSASAPWSRQRPERMRVPSAWQHAVEFRCRRDVLPFLNASRYCETDRLIDTAWSLFGGSLAGWPLVQRSVNSRSQPSTVSGDERPLHKTALDAHQEASRCRDSPIWRSASAVA